MNEVLTCPICDSTNVEIVYWPHTTEGEPYCMLCCVSYPRAMWKRFSEATTLLRAVAILSEHCVTFRVTPDHGWSISHAFQRVHGDTLATALIALAKRLDIPDSLFDPRIMQPVAIDVPATVETFAPMPVEEVE